VSKTTEWLESAELVVGESDLLASVREEAREPTLEDAALEKRLERNAAGVITDFRIRIGTLLRADNVAILLGAGSSVCAGGPLLGSLPLTLERALIQSGVDKGTVSDWLELLYAAVHAMDPSLEVPTTAQEMEARLEGEPSPFPVNLESLLVLLSSWRAALECSCSSLTLGNGGAISMDKDTVDRTLDHVTSELASLCELPGIGTAYELEAHRRLLKRLLLRPLNLKRASLFTLNYDTLLEKAADAEGIVLVDGFVGAQKRTFRPESYDQDLYFPAETTEGRVSRLDRVLHLYKLHGSVSWQTEVPALSNPYGVSNVQGVASEGRALIYPTPMKYGDTLGMPYAELFRRFARLVVRPQSVLFVVGYGFGDEHVNAIIRQALAVPSFTLVIIDPNAPQPSSKGGFVARLRAQNDPRVWVVGGENLGSLELFVEKLMPDLQEEDILRRVLATSQAVSAGVSGCGEEAGVE